MSLQNFISNLNTKGGFSKNNRFWVHINLPEAIGVDYSSRDLKLLCESTALPGKVLNTTPVKVYGPTYEIPYQKQYDTIDFNFLCTNEGNERLIFDKWIEYIMPSQTNNMRFPRGTDGLSGYLTEIYIRQYNDVVNYGGETPEKITSEDVGDLIREVQLQDAFPKQYSAQPLNWGDDGFLRLTVQFCYRRFIEL